ncbi:MAG: hypothetical protein K2Q10_06720, partial [Rhodospirillales bacterium]|nr:hypothetical protein [Rhodospirillales bacterium]
MGDSNGTALHEAFPLLRQANPLRDNHRFAEAEALVRRAVALAPHSPLTWIDLGLLLRCAGRLDEAEQAYRHAVSRPLGILHAGPQLAGLLLQTDRAEEGLDTFRASLAMSRAELERDGLYVARPSGVPFSHIALCLLEGLEGCIPIHAAEALDHDGRRLAEAGRAAKDCALVLVDVSESQAMPPNLAGIAPNRLMMMGQQDSVNDLMLPRQAMFAAHQNRFWPVPGLRLPWGFGLSRRMIRDIGTPPPYHQRGRNVLRAFRPSQNQDIRNLLDLTLLPALERILPVDRGLDQGHAYHHAAASDFYDRLKQAYTCLAYGGGLRV